MCQDIGKTGSDPWSIAIYRCKAYRKKAENKNWTHNNFLCRTPCWHSWEESAEKLLCYQCRFQWVNAVLLYVGEVTWKQILKGIVGIKASTTYILLQEKERKEKK